MHGSHIQHISWTHEPWPTPVAPAFAGAISGHSPPINQRLRHAGAAGIIVGAYFNQVGHGVAGLCHQCMRYIGDSAKDNVSTEVVSATLKLIVVQNTWCRIESYDVWEYILHTRSHCRVLMNSGAAFLKANST